MLKDVKFKTKESDPGTFAVLETIGRGADHMFFERIAEGQYIGHHHNFRHTVQTQLQPHSMYASFKSSTCPGCSPHQVIGIWFHADDCRAPPTDLTLYGVCDSIEQFNDKFLEVLQASADAYCVSFTEVRKADQPDHGGWRWHKWGPYVGAGEPQYEYLAEEEGFESVFCFHIYKIVV